jgi:2,5-diketo-D-gluconate reductase A
MDTSIPINGGEKMPQIGFGTYLMSSEQCEEACLTALKMGYRHIDTAEYYDNHMGIAKAIKASGIPREEIYITDKVSPNGIFGMPSATYDDIFAALRQRLALLETSYVDCYLLHHPWAKDERVNQFRALVDAKKQGLIKHIGVSNWAERHIEELKATDPSLPYPDANQIEIHPLCCQKKLVPYLKEKGITIIAYSSLAPSSTWRAEPGQDKLSFDGEAHRPVIEAMSTKYNVKESQLLLRWAIQHGYGILPKSRNKERIQNNTEIFHFTISNEDMAALDALDQNAAVAWPIGNPLEAE